jgi:ubiquinone biosynthesis protein
MSVHALTHECFDVTAVVPDCYAAYRPVVVDAIEFFLTRLSPLRLRDVVRAQAELPLDASAADRLVTLMHQCPVLHKLGQVIARHHALDAGFRAKLQELEMREPRTPFEAVWTQIERELGDAIQRYDIVIGRVPLAEASVAVVWPITWSGGEGVLKLMRPGVEIELDEDLRIVAELADHLDERQARGKMPPLQYRRTFDDVAELLRNEVRFEMERANLTAAQAVARRCDGVIVPALLPFASEHITAMQRVTGVRVTEGAARHRRLLARRAARSLVADALLGREGAGLFHADPHAGNLLADGDGRLIVLDWSLADRLTEGDRHGLIALYVAAAWRDSQRIADAMTRLASSAPTANMDSVLRRWVAQHDDRPLPRFTDMLQLTDDLAMSGVRFPHRLMLFRKAVFTLDGVVNDTCPEVTLSQLVEATMAERIAMGEWPWRLVLPITSRALPSAISTLDLCSVIAAATAWAWSHRAYSPCSR